MIGQRLIMGPVLQHPGADHMTILWETHEAVRGEVTCAGPGAGRIGVKDPVPCCLHRSLLTGLRPSATYNYEVMIDSRTVSRGSFRTLPESGPYRAVVLGDLHAPAEGFQMLVPHIEEADPDFIIILGDIVASGLRRSDWLSFFEMGRDLFGRIPFTAVIGNHDAKRDTTLYDRYVGSLNGAPPGYYYFSAEVARDYYLFLDSRNDRLLLHEAAWLIGHLWSLAGRTDIRHVFIFSHLGPVSFKEHRRGFAGLKPLLPLMGMAGVSAIFSGHDHHYLRGTTHWGFPFFVSGGGGGKLYPVSRTSPFAWMVGRKEFEASSHQFLVLEIDDGESTVRAVDGSGLSIDRVGLSSRSGRLRARRPGTGGYDSKNRRGSAEPGMAIGTAVVIE